MKVIKQTRYWKALPSLLLSIFSGCNDSPTIVPNPEIERLFNSADDGSLCDELFMIIADRFHFLDGSSDEERMMKLAAEERVVYLVWKGKGIIDNGGFEYMFECDIPGDPGYLQTAWAFEQIDCEQAAMAVREAMSLFPDSCVPLDIHMRRKLYEQVPESEREKINDKFFSSDWEEAGEFQLRRKLAEYIRKHKAVFAKQ